MNVPITQKLSAQEKRSDDDDEQEEQESETKFPSLTTSFRGIIADKKGQTYKVNLTVRSSVEGKDGAYKLLYTMEKGKSTPFIKLYSGKPNQNPELELRWTSPESGDFLKAVRQNADDWVLSDKRGIKVSLQAKRIEMRKKLLELRVSRKTHRRNYGSGTEQQNRASFEQEGGATWASGRCLERAARTDGAARHADQSAE